jgi:hypothetical protein
MRSLPPVTILFVRTQTQTVVVSFVVLYVSASHQHKLDVIEDWCRLSPPVTAGTGRIVDKQCRAAS